MKIGFIGAGKVGFSLGKYFSLNKLNVVGIYSRNKLSAIEASEFIGIKQYETIDEIVNDSDIIFLTVSDTAVLEVWNYIKNLPINNKIICHCSGALSSNIFDGINDLKAYGYSLHPLLSISNKLFSYTLLKDACFTLEGSIKKLDFMQTMIEQIGNKTYIIPTEKKVLYHCAAVFSSNFMVALAQIGLDLLKDCGFDEESSSIIFPLMTANVQNIVSQGTTKALTGPVERCDIGTITSHLSKLSGEEKELYRLLSKKLIAISKVKNPHINYKNLESIMEGTK